MKEVLLVVFLGRAITCTNRATIVLVLPHLSVYQCSVQSVPSCCGLKSSFNSVGRGSCGDFPPTNSEVYPPLQRPTPQIIFLFSFKSCTLLCVSSQNWNTWPITTAKNKESNRSENKLTCAHANVSMTIFLLYRLRETVG